MLGNFVSMDRYGMLLSATRAGWLRFGPDVMANNYNRRPFLVTHRLAEHSAFNLHALFALC